MPEVRRADPDDAAELTRLRIVMFTDMGRDPSRLDEDWRRRNVSHFRRRLAETDLFAAYVVDGPAGRLAASAVGWLNEHLIGTANPVGKVGYIANMCTDPAHRRRGYGRAHPGRTARLAPLDRHHHRRPARHPRRRAPLPRAGLHRPHRPRPHPPLPPPMRH
jgi:GNAT superfamily N-acetyltransferase